MYRKLEHKSEKVMAQNPGPESKCNCPCTKEVSKDGTAKPEATSTTDNVADHYDIGGK